MGQLKQALEKKEKESQEQNKMSKRQWEKNVIYKCLKQIGKHIMIGIREHVTGTKPQAGSVPTNPKLSQCLKYADPDLDLTLHRRTNPVPNPPQEQQRLYPEILEEVRRNPPPYSPPLTKPA